MKSIRSHRRQRGAFSLVLLAAAAANLLVVLSAQAAPDPVRSWNELALQTVRVKSASDSAAARLYAMVNVAIYDAVNGIDSRHGNRLDREQALVAPTNQAKGDLNAAAAAAAHAVLSGEYPDLQASMYDPQLASDLAAAGHGNKIEQGRAWGAYVGTQVRAARANDGSSPNETQPAGSGPGQFRAAWSGVQYRNLAPFGIADPSIYVGPGPAPLASLDYAASFVHVKVVGSAANVDQGKLDTLRFWSLGSGTSQPPGAWLQIALNVTTQNPLALPEMSRLFALLSMAMVDSVAPTVMTKFTYRHWRPATAIQEANTDANPLTDQDAGWTPRAGGIGTSPEYWSGHTSFSAAAAAALAGFFCADTIPFTLRSDSAPGGIERSYASFSAAAAEAGLSRVVGGIHFEFSNTDGNAAGRGVAKEILATKLRRTSEPTHFGECPL